MLFLNFALLGILITEKGSLRFFNVVQTMQCYYGNRMTASLNSTIEKTIL